MSDRDSFGPRLRRERERRGITLEMLATSTKVNTDLWVGLERNDFSRWPSGIFARAFVRDYARTLGLDADAVVDDFCRHFEKGDRRAIRIVEAQGELIGHQVQKTAGAEPLPAGRERRSANRGSAQPPAMKVKYGAACDCRGHRPRVRELARDAVVTHRWRRVLGGRGAGGVDLPHGRDGHCRCVPRHTGRGHHELAHPGAVRARPTQARRPDVGFSGRLSTALQNGRRSRARSWLQSATRHCPAPTACRLHVS